MTLTNLGSPMIFGPVIPVPAGATSGTETTTFADGADEGFAVIFQAQESVTIDVMSFRLTAASACVLSCSIEGLDTSGNPDGTPVGSAVTTASLTGAQTVEVTGLGASVTAGTMYAARVKYSSGTSATILMYAGTSNALGMPHTSQYIAAAWTQSSAGGGGAAMGIGTSTTAYLAWPSIRGPYTLSDVSFNTASNPDEYGLRFQVPVTMRCVGLAAIMAMSAAGAFGITLTDSSGNDVGSTYKSYDTDIHSVNTDETWTFLRFASAFTLVAGTTYVIGIRSEGAAINVVLRRATMNTNGQLGAYYSKEWHQASRETGTTAWTLTDTICPYIWPLIDQLDDGAGGGGGMLVHPGMAGRISG